MQINLQCDALLDNAPVNMSKKVKLLCWNAGFSRWPNHHTAHARYQVILIVEEMFAWISIFKSHGHSDRCITGRESSQLLPGHNSAIPSNVEKYIELYWK